VLLYAAKELFKLLKRQVVMVVTRSQRSQRISGHSFQNSAALALKKTKKQKTVKKKPKKKKLTKTEEKSVDKYLSSIYYDPKKAGSFAGAVKLFEQAKKDGQNLKLSQIEKWLNMQETYTLYKRPQQVAQRSEVQTLYPGFLLDSDLMSMQGVSSHNKGFTFVLVVIDVFSRFLWARAIQNKEGKTVSKKLTEIFDTIPYKIERFRTDNGSEYKNSWVKKVLSSRSVKIQYTNNETKANYAESCIKTLKSKIYKYFNHKQTYKYIDVLQDIVKSYNDTYHSSIKRAPSEINSKNASYIWWELNIPKKIHPKKITTYNPKIFKYNIGDNVRIQHGKHAFSREYHQKWTSEIFIIRNRMHRTGVPVYKIMDYNSDKIRGTFYENELQKVLIDDNMLWKIEKIIKKRTRKGEKEYLIRWMGFGQAFDSWVSSSEVKDFAEKK
jgi:transposase InsO family protein